MSDDAAATGDVPAGARRRHADLSEEITDADHRFGRGYRPGFLTIGVISTGQCMLFGHGPGPSSLMSGPEDAFALVDDPGANLAAWLHGGTEPGQ